MVTQLAKKRSPAAQLRLVENGPLSSAFAAGLSGGVQMKASNSDIVSHLFGQVAPGAKVECRNAAECLQPFYGLFEIARAAFSDYKVDVYSMIANGDTVTACYNVTGCKNQSFIESAGNAGMAIHGIDIFRLDSGKIVGYRAINHQFKIQMPRAKVAVPA